MISIFIFLVLISPYFHNRIAYPIIAALAVYGFVSMLGYGLQNFKVPRGIKGLIYCLPALIVFFWVYGVTLGLVNGVKVEYVFANFAGLSVYAVFYVLIALVNQKGHYKAIFFAAVAASIYGVGMLFIKYLGGGIDMGTDSLSSARTIYSGTFLYVAPFIFVYLVSHIPGERLGTRNDIKNIGFPVFVIFSFVLLVPALSKGFILVYVLMMAVFFVASMAYIGNSGKTTVFFGFFVFCTCLSAAYILMFTNVLDIAYFTFSGKEESNAIRSEQFNYLVDEWTWSGSGLGSSLVSGFSRDESGYGFELTYINLINKLGIFTIPLFISYLIPLGFGLIKVFSKGSRKIGAWVLGLMAYLLPGAGNPLLLAPEFVIFHCLALVTILQYKQIPAKVLVNKNMKVNYD